MGPPTCVWMPNWQRMTTVRSHELSELLWELSRVVGTVVQRVFQRPVKETLLAAHKRLTVAAQSAYRSPYS